MRDTINILVCDPEIPKFGNLLNNNEEFETNGDNIISSQEVEKFVIKGIEKHDLIKDCFS
jgi:hypothetical protein